MHTVQFLAVVLVSLGVTVGTLSKQAAERIIVVHLLHRAGGIADDTVVAKMVLEIIILTSAMHHPKTLIEVGQELLHQTIVN